MRALGSLYMRLTGTSIDCYKYLEPLYLDYRKLKRQNKDGGLYSDVTTLKEFFFKTAQKQGTVNFYLPEKYILFQSCMLSNLCFYY